MMLLSAAITQVLQHLAFDLDSFEGEAPTQAQSIAVLNWAMREVARKIFLVDNNITIALSNGVSDYNLNDTTLFVGPGARGVRIIRPYYVILNALYLKDRAGRKGLWTMEQLDHHVTNWRTLAAGTPVRALRVGGQFLRLNPAPNASAVAAGGFLAAQYAPADMTSGEAALPMPIHEDLHEAICYLAAYKHAVPNVSESEGMSRLKMFNSEAMQVIENMRIENYNAMAYDGTEYDLPRKGYVYL